MKRLFFIALLMISGWAFAQNTNSSLDWKNMSPQQRKEAISRMSPEERRMLFRNFRERMLIRDLRIPEENQEKFKQLYGEYQAQQRKIKDKFHHPKDLKELSDADARKHLDSSFIVAQQLLDNRREYAKRFQTILKPQQILKMFHIEGKIRSDMMIKRD